MLLFKNHAQTRSWTAGGKVLEGCISEPRPDSQQKEAASSCERWKRGENEQWQWAHTAQPLNQSHGPACHPTSSNQLYQSRLPHPSWEEAWARWTPSWRSKYLARLLHIWTFLCVPWAGGCEIAQWTVEAGHFAAETPELQIDMMRSTKKKKVHPHQPEHMSVWPTLGEWGDSTGSYGLQQTLSHICLAPIWAQVATALITGVLVGGITEPLARACAFVDLSKVDVTEWVNTIWVAALLDQDQSSPLTAEDDLGPPSPSPSNWSQIRQSSHLRLTSTCRPAAFNNCEWGCRPMEERCSAALFLLSGSREGLEAFLGFN